MSVVVTVGEIFDPETFKMNGFHLNVKRLAKRAMPAAKDGQILWFETREEAEAAAKELQEKMNEAIDAKRALDAQ